MGSLSFRSIASGSSGNCSIVTDGEFMAVFDFGISVRKFRSFLDEAGLEPEYISLFISHEHSDHAGNVMPFSRKISGDIYARPLTLEAIGVEGYPVNETVVFGNFSISAVSVSHDAIDPVAFVIESSGRKISIVSDLGQASPALTERIRNSDILAIEANHDIGMLQNGSYPDQLKRRIRGEKGHLSNNQCGELSSAAAGDSTRLVLLHLSRENNTPQIARKTVGLYMKMEGKDSNQIICATQENGTDFISIP